MNQADIMWLAGLLEGEGCFTISHYTKMVDGEPKTYYYGRIALAMTDEDVVRRAYEIAQCGNVTKLHSEKRGNRKPLFRWQVGDRKSVARILLAVYPIMGHRRQERIAEIVMFL